MPSGYDRATERVSLGHGEAVWAFAKTLVDDWTVYPQTDWVGLSEYPEIRPGAQVMVLVRMLGTWWTSPCRVVYTVDEPNRYGFAYGTLPGHVECGEELFVMTRDPATGEVHYEIRVMARAAHPLAKALPPVVGFMQRRFRAAAFAQVSEVVEAWGKDGRGGRETGNACRTPVTRTEPRPPQSLRSFG